MISYLVEGLVAPFSFLKFQAFDAQAPRDLGSDTQVLPRSEYSVVIHDFCGSVYSDCSGSPWFDGLQVVDGQGDRGSAILNVLVFPRPVEDVLAVASNVEILAVELEPYRHNIRLTVRRDRGKPAQTLSLHVLNLRFRKQSQHQRSLQISKYKVTTSRARQSPSPPEQE